MLLRLADGTALALRSARQLGRVRLVEGPEALVRALELGPDALEMNRDTFLARARGRPRQAKA